MPWTGRTVKDLHAKVEITPERFERYVELFETAAAETGMNEETRAHFAKILNSYRAHVVNIDK
jgi:truncated hemoglobin YjbI